MRVRAAAGAILGCAWLAGATSAPALRGFTAQSAPAEREAEARFLDVPSAAGALRTAGVIGARPHYAGSDGDRALAVTMRDALQQAGVPAELESFTARVDTPKRLALELIADPAYAPASSLLHRGRGAPPIALDLREQPEPSDPATADGEVSIPFNAGSADGDVTAPLAYASRGRDADYDALAKAGVDVRGAVVLVRYGAQFRGLLAERAQARGAAGVIFYSDPADDGAARGPVYPDGPWRPGTSVQRGTLGDNVRIPALPVSSANARVLLQALRGPAGPAGFGGALPVAYPLARGPARVHLVVQLDHRTATLWNTVGRITGTRPNELVLLGAHRDAWVAGVGDNGAGIITLLEMARGLGLLAQGGWRPRRTIVIAGWDGEEIGEAGSREYVRRHARELAAGGVAYLNADENITGTRIAAAAAAALAPLVVDASRDVRDPAAEGRSLYERWAEQNARAPQAGVLGGGSDHEAFLFDAGVPAADFGFHGPFGVYHSSYDTVRYATTYSDPGFVLHRTAAQVYGILAMRLADADAVPYAFGGYVPVLRAGYAQIAPRAARLQPTPNSSALRAAIERFAAAAPRADRRIDAARRSTRRAHSPPRTIWTASSTVRTAMPARHSRRSKRRSRPAIPPRSRMPSPTQRRPSTAPPAASARCNGPARGVRRFLSGKTPTV